MAYLAFSFFSIVPEMIQTFIIWYELSYPLLIEIHVLLIQPLCDSCFHLIIALKLVAVKVLLKRW
jgi:hypothetical protein